MRFFLLLSTLIFLTALGRSMKFPDVSNPSFEKNPCSPTGELKGATALLAQIPQEITWGDPLPVCGVIKAPEYMDITVRILAPDQQDIPGVISSSIDLVPLLSSFSEAQKEFKKNGYLFFNTNGFSNERNPPPGKYSIELESYDGKSKVSLPLHIKAEGKKYDFAEKLKDLICKKQGLKTYQNYFNAVSALESCGDPQPGQEKNEPNQTTLKNNIHQEWKKIWPQFEKDFSTFQKSDLIVWSGYYEQKPMVHVVSQLVKKSCPNQLDPNNGNVPLRMLVESFGELAKPKPKH